MGSLLLFFLTISYFLKFFLLVKAGCGLYWAGLSPRGLLPEEEAGKVVKQRSTDAYFRLSLAPLWVGFFFFFTFIFCILGEAVLFNKRWCFSLPFHLLFLCWAFPLPGMYVYGTLSLLYSIHL
ncbi:hypothetical protein B0T24DRAFT_177491 [Lasiosphaeria ovina]|uniref:Uncharacterized protein n=1 Tax=Lasiosphaeria ovina TaxID=92902 RepID=A0AAE0TTS3_9PEZI|nr:hypothetical protein B0T24DRAFT_177491 [Lasiosphaeria ovina]